MNDNNKTTMTIPPMIRRAAPILGLALAALCALGVRAADDKKAASAAPKPALTVTVTQPQQSALTRSVAANGNIAAWQEASIGTEANGLRLADVKVNVGDVVKRGQVLATFAPDTMQADVAQIRAAVAEAEATLAEAAANAQRARGLQATGALSEAAINQYLTAERTAQARLEAQRASANMQQLRLKMTQVLAPDFGVISARHSRRPWRIMRNSSWPAGSTAPRSRPTTWRCSSRACPRSSRPAMRRRSRARCA